MIFASAYDRHVAQLLGVLNRVTTALRATSAAPPARDQRRASTWSALRKPFTRMLSLVERCSALSFEERESLILSECAEDRLLADPSHASLKVKQAGADVSVELPEKAPDVLASVLCLECGD